MQGKFIVLYGVNRVGKTTQTKLLANYLNSQGFDTEMVKDPYYSISPSGRYINLILRKGKRKDISVEETQLWYAINRYQFKSQLEKMLEKGRWVVSEDYIGTGIAWGLVERADQQWLEEINKYLTKPDLEILIDGESFPGAREVGHRHEDDDELMKQARNKHLFLARRYDWPIVAANQPPDQVHAQIVNLVMQRLLIGNHS